MRATLAGYYGSIDHVDNQLALLLNRLAAIENTTILFTSDHGEMLGDHYRFRKSAPYQGAVHIPFVLCGPDIPAAVCEPGVVGLQDVLPTFCELADVPVPSHVTGRSVLGSLRGEQNREFLHGEHASMQSAHSGFHYLTDGLWKYIWFNDGTEQLFDLKNDARETRDLAGEAAGAEQLALWRRRLIEQLRGRPEGFSDGQTLIPHRNYPPQMPHAIAD